MRITAVASAGVGWSSGNSADRAFFGQYNGLRTQDVNALLKQFDMMAPVMKAMAGKGMGQRMQAIQELQQSGMFNPGNKMGKLKGDTGKRLTSKEKAELRKKREKELKKKKGQGPRGAW
jgi:signal recognition particle subunit SRP54